MEVIRKSFLQSKIIIGGLVMFIAGTVQAITGFYLAPEVLNTVTPTIWDAINLQSVSGAITAAAGLYITISRFYLKMDQIEEDWWKSKIFLSALVAFIAQIAYYYTGIELPADLQAGLLTEIIVLINGGEFVAFILQAFPIVINIWRVFSTTTEVEVPKPALTFYKAPLKQAA